MTRRRPLLGMLIAVMVGFYALGASQAALALAAPECAAPASRSDCDHAMVAHACAAACAAAVMPDAPRLAPRVSHGQDVAPKIEAFTAALHPGPEPPPPRSA